jgi:hypothetical protein
MDKRDLPPISVMIAAAAYLLPIALGGLVLILLSEPLRIAFGMVAGCLFIWGTVRSINRWHDRRRINGPPDAP